MCIIKTFLDCFSEGAEFSICFTLLITGSNLTVKNYLKRLNFAQWTFNKIKASGIMSSLNSGKRYRSTKKVTSACTSLTIWGENLPSLVGGGKLSNLATANIVLPLYQYSVLVGLLLSDGFLWYPTAHHKNVRLGFEQSYAHMEYVWFVFSILSHYCSRMPDYRSRVRKGKKSVSITLVTRGGVILFYSFAFIILC